MNNILVLTSKCYIDSRADGVCGRNLYCGLIKENENTYLLGYTQNQSYQSNNSGEYVFYYDNKKKKSVTYLRVFRPEINKQLCDLYIDNAEKIIIEKNIDTLVPVFFPLETLIAAYKLKQKYPYLKVIDYEVDSTTDVIENSSRLGALYIKAAEKYMKHLYRQFDFVFIMKSHMNDVKKRYHNVLTNKIVEIDSPVLLIQNKEYSLSIEDDIIDFMYTGLLKKDVYSPEPILKLFADNINQDKWRLHFYTRGDCEEIIQKASKNDHRIICHGYVDLNTLEEAMKKADVFISIEYKTKPASIPSKAFPYFLTRKPVIHFYSGKYDYFVKEYINRYPFGLSVRNDQTINPECINEMICKSRNNPISIDNIVATFIMNTPEYSAKKIMDVLRKNNG